ncbi:hypothetical protein Tco_0891695 [Tanacetum coccineum]|uniref:Retrotransposon protein, putative, Ty1-copia subclass n=1 Tax=Tanacetum coccineum TaxID=301880 RepID=A0ABQ5C567_9ASTR
MQKKLKLSKSQGASTPVEVKRMQNITYASAVGSIMYAVRCTRPDVALAQNITSRFQHNQGDLHWTVVKSILKYLRNTKAMFLVYGGDIKQELRVSCYTDAGYLTDVDDLKSQTRYVFVLNGGVVDWKSTKAITIANESGKVHIDDNLADPFTKALPLAKHSDDTQNIGIVQLVVSCKSVFYMVVKEIEDGLLEEIERFRWWFKQDIDGESKDDNEKKLVMVNEEGWMIK